MLAERQHGVASVRQLAEIGLSAKAARQRAEVGRYRRLHRGVYGLGAGELADDGRWMAATLACREAALSHTSAARAWGLLDVPEPPVHVTVPEQGRDRK